MKNTDKEPKYTLKEAKSIVNAIGGNARLDKYGVKSMVKMAKKSWENPSIKREAFAIVRKALTEFKKEQLGEINAIGWAKCELCTKKIAPVLRQNVVPRDWNHPFDVMVACDICIKKFKPRLLTEDMAKRILEVNKKYPYIFDFIFHFSRE